MDAQPVEQETPELTPFEQHKQARREANKNLRRYLKGKLFWDSRTKGTYVKANQ